MLKDLQNCSLIIRSKEQRGMIQEDINRNQSLEDILNKRKGREEDDDDHSHGESPLKKRKPSDGKRRRSVKKSKALNRSFGKRKSVKSSKRSQRRRKSP
jgi:hypothetical protein